MIEFRCPMGSRFSVTELMRFQKLILAKWKQFEAVDLDLHPHVTIITGANGSGKTTILHLFDRHFGWGFSEVATPSKDSRTGTIGYLFSRLWQGITRERDRIKIGEFRYTDSKVSPILIPEKGSATYQPEISDQQQVFGLSIQSHRPIYGYANVPHVSTQKRDKKQAFELFTSHSRSRYFGGSGAPVNFVLKETLIGWAIFGGGNQFIEPDIQQSQYFRGFEEILCKVLPPHLGFTSLVIRGQNDVVLSTKTGDFVLDALSGGLSAIVDLAWQIYLASTETREMTVVIDEVENHLHASMQRRLLPSFIEAFPKVQFIVSTHSPLIIGSVRDSAVYALRYNSENRVFSTRLDLKEKAKAANDILREVLDVPVTLPLWVEQKIEEIVRKYREAGVRNQSFADFRRELADAGLEEMTTEAFIRLAGGSDD